MLTEGSSGEINTKNKVGAIAYRRRMVTNLKLIGCWPRAGVPRPNMGRITLLREISKGIKFLDDDALVAVMWMVNALALPARY
jgi:hypothetical protein